MIWAGLPILMILLQDGYGLPLGIAADPHHNFSWRCRGEDQVMPLRDATKCIRLEEGLEKPRPVILRDEGRAVFLPHQFRHIGLGRLVDHMKHVIQAPRPVTSGTSALEARSTSRVQTSCGRPVERTSPRSC